MFAINLRIINKATGDVVREGYLTHQGLVREFKTYDDAVRHLDGITAGIHDAAVRVNEYEYTILSVEDEVR